MKSRLTFIGVSLAMILALVLLFTTSVQKRERPDMSKEWQVKADSGLTEEKTIVDDIPEQVIPLEPEPAETLQVSFAEVRAVAFWDGRIAAGTGGGVFTWNPVDSSYQFFHYANGLENFDVQAVLEKDGKLLVGSCDGLSEIDKSGKIAAIDFGFESPVTALAQSGETLLIGTAADGLISYQEDSGKCLLEVPEITAIAVSGDQIWVATDGYGLYSYNGEKWKRRYLDNDTTALDCIADLGFKFNRLYAGTLYGMWVFDGGRWIRYSEEDGLLVCDVREIDFKGWKIVVGTSNWGIYEIFEDVVTPKAWSEGLEITALAANDRYTVVGTPNDGLYVADGEKISHINPTPQTFTRPVVAEIH